MNEPPPEAGEDRGSGWHLGDVVDGRKALVDAVVPTVLFALFAATTGVGVAAAVALAWCGGVLLWRVARRQSLTAAVSGLGGVSVGIVVALLTGDAESFFLPGIIGNVVFGVLCVVSVVVGRPAIAWTSAALYRWPPGWYWHPKVRPAYTEITLVWAVAYLGKAVWQYQLVRADALATLTTVRLATGWPALLGLLGITYAYLRWRLDRLGGPDVEQWRAQQARV